MLAGLIAWIVFQEAGEPPLLLPDQVVEGSIHDRDPRVETEILSRDYNAPAVGKSLVLRIAESGPYSIELRSNSFDAYLVLRAETGEIVAEDDDGLLCTHARIATELEAGKTYPLDACALEGERGAFELRLVRGTPPELPPRERAEAELAEARRIVAWREENLGPEHPDFARALNNLARTLKDQGDLAAARSLFERVVRIREKVLGAEHPETASSLNNLAALLRAQGDYMAARPLYERSLAIREKVLGPEHPDTATSCNNLAYMLQSQGDYSAARLLFERALAIWEKTLGPEHPQTVTCANNLATFHKDLGDYAAARPLFERAAALREKLLGPEHPKTALSLNNLALLLQAQGDYAAAIPACQRALAIREKVLGPEHPETAESIYALGFLFDNRGDPSAARPLYERSLAIWEKALGPEHPHVASNLDSLAGVLHELGDDEQARMLQERALAIREKVLGPEHTSTASSLQNIATMLERRGDYAAARSGYERSLAIREKLLGADHPDTARSRHSLALLAANEGALAKSWDSARKTLESSLTHARGVLWSLSEKERYAFLGQGDLYLRSCLSAAASLRDPEVQAQAYELALAWRGLVSHTLLESREHLRASTSTEALAIVENLQGVQARLSKLLYATEIPDREQVEHELHALRERRNELEVELQRLAGPSVERAVTLAELEESLEPGSALVDFLVHPLYEPAQREDEKIVRKGGWTPDRLSAWVVRHDRELVHVDLGPASEIERSVQGWLGRIVTAEPIVAARGVRIDSDEASPETEVGLRALLWDPLAPHLEGVERVFVRPDSFLGTLPFEVLPLEGDRYLIEDKSFVYVHTPLDLVEKKERVSGAPSSLLVAGGVDFRKRAGLDESPRNGSPIVASVTRGDALRGSLNQSWNRLLHTEGEAHAVYDLHEAAFGDGRRLFLSADAPTEERLKEELPRHSILHLATHGFFHPEGTVSMWDSAREEAAKEKLQDLQQETGALIGQFPGFLTGLVCAGANEPAPEGRDDGLLTAEEVLWLDLSNVELVVLSACETALGERRAGEGMIGLRRAFGLAGAKTVVSSLWSVKDRSTSELMRRFYENLWLEKQGRAEALRNAQLEILEKNRAEERDSLPSTWGAFVLSGDWR